MHYSEHTLVIGGTGMLSGVSLAYAQQGVVTSVVARTSATMERLLIGSGENRKYIQPILVDYSQTEKFGQELRSDIARHGPYTTCVAWVHSYARGAFHVLEEVLATQDVRCKLYHVCGSATSDPRQREIPFSTSANLEYHRVILGFINEGNRSRWLTDEEISEGVLEAIRLDRSETIVGVIEPWSARP